MDSIYFPLLNAIADIFEYFILRLMDAQLSCFSGQFFKIFFNAFFLIVPVFYY